MTRCAARLGSLGKNGAFVINLLREAFCGEVDEGLQDRIKKAAFQEFDECADYIKTFGDKDLDDLIGRVTIDDLCE